LAELETVFARRFGETNLTPRLKTGAFCQTATTIGSAPSFSPYCALRITEKSQRAIIDPFRLSLPTTTNNSCYWLSERCREFRLKPSSKSLPP
jgi:hypothetical protein